MSPRVRARATVLLAVAALAVPTLAACSQGGNSVRVDVRAPSATASAEAPGASEGAAPGVTTDGVPDVVGTVAEGLEAPWGIAFLPDGSALVTERDSARVLRVVPAGTGAGTVEEVGRVRIARPGGEGGLLGIAVSPDFATDATVFLYVTAAEDNRVVRATFADGRLGPVEPILTGIPKAAIHNGGRLAFGPDGYLYVSTGDARQPAAAPDRDSLAGKILRIDRDGAPAPQNPFGTPVWSLGHRNVQGLAFDTEGLLWASEFGDDTSDELNRILPGADHGWPDVEGEGDGGGRFTAPALTWPTEEASPSGLAATNGYLWMAALRGQRLWRISVAAGQAKDPTPYLQGEPGDGGYGRLRSVASAPDGRLWVATSNTDGRGDAREGDDRILLIDP